jgi:hypothetical protein
MNEYDPGIVDRFPAKAREFSGLQKFQTVSGPIQPLFIE